MRPLTIGKIFDYVDKNIVRMLKIIGMPFLRYSLAVIFIWFGIQKPLGVSPAVQLVAKTIYFFSPDWFVPLLGWWEVAIGICLLYRPLVRMAIFLLLIQLVGTFLPFILLPEVMFGPRWYALTLEGQFILKNLVLIAAALVIGSHVRDGKRS